MGRSPRRRAGGPVKTPPKLGGVSDAAAKIESDLGIPYQTAHRYKLAATVLDKDPGWFDRYKKQCDETERDFTQNAIDRRARELKQKAAGK